MVALWRRYRHRTLFIFEIGEDDMTALRTASDALHSAMAADWNEEVERAKRELRGTGLAEWSKRRNGQTGERT